MTAIEVVAALEKALEAGPTAWGVFAMVDGEMTIQYPVALSPASAKGHADMYRGETIEIRPLYTTDPHAIRTLLDAHASALRDAARYRWLVANNFDRQATQIHTWLSTWEPHSATGEPAEWRQRIHGSYLDVLIDAEIAALDDNTKGAAA